MMDFYRGMKRRGKFLPLFTETEVNNCFSTYQTSGYPVPIGHLISDRLAKNARVIQDSAGRGIEHELRPV